MHIASIGIDLGKTTFHLVALGEQNKVLLRKKFSRTQLVAYTGNDREFCGASGDLTSNVQFVSHDFSGQYYPDFSTTMVCSSRPTCSLH